MCNDDIIHETIKAAFQPEELAALLAKTHTPESIAAYAADPALLACEDFHTFAEWKRLGYSVRKGEHATLTVSLWKFSDRPTKAQREAATAAGEDPEESGGGDHFYKVKSFLFHRLQVEKLSR